MIKLMISLVKIIVTAFIALLFGSCNFNLDLGENNITGSGNVVSKERNLTAFDKITVTKGLDCEVTQGNTFSVIVEADDNLVNNITTKVVNGTLEIDSKYNSYTNVTSKKVKVQLPKISGLEATGAASIKTSNEIKGNNIILSSSSAGYLEANVNSENVSLESNSGSTLNASGKAINLNADGSSGSHIKASKLLANNITSESSSGSSIEVFPIIKLTAQASSGGNIQYFNKPKTISKEESSGGSVNQE